MECSVKSCHREAEPPFKMCAYCRERNRERVKNWTQQTNLPSPHVQGPRMKPVLRSPKIQAAPPPPPGPVHRFTREELEAFARERGAAVSPKVTT